MCVTHTNVYFYKSIVCCLFSCNKRTDKFGRTRNFGNSTAEFKKMDITKQSKMQLFNQEQVENAVIYCCRQCYVDIFLETHILYYVPSDKAYFVKQRESINFTPGRSNRINCSNCESYLGKVIYHSPGDNELRLTGIVPKYIFR